MNVCYTFHRIWPNCSEIEKWKRTLQNKWYAQCKTNQSEIQSFNRITWNDIWLENEFGVANFSFGMNLWPLDIYSVVMKWKIQMAKWWLFISLQIIIKITFMNRIDMGYEIWPQLILFFSFHSCLFNIFIQTNLYAFINKSNIQHTF